MLGRQEKLILPVLDVRRSLLADRIVAAIETPGYAELLKIGTTSSLRIFRSEATSLKIILFVRPS